MNKIPRKIHVTCKNKAEPGLYKVFLDSMKNINNSWELILYDDEDAAVLIQQHYNYLWEIYNGFPTNIQRMDIFRILVVYLHGGFYLDADMYCLNSLDDLCGEELVLAEEKTLTAEQCAQLNHQHPMRIANYMFGAMPSHPFLAELAAAAFATVIQPVTKEEDVLETTGPGLLTNFYHQRQPDYPRIRLLHNDYNLCLKQCCDTASCHFGEYAVHLHMGSWRWQTVTHEMPSSTTFPDSAIVENALAQFRRETHTNIHSTL